jgi:hypothetical protein
MAKNYFRAAVDRICHWETYIPVANEVTGKVITGTGTGGYYNVN